jgi:hypothetical protein
MAIATDNRPQAITNDGNRRTTSMRPFGKFAAAASTLAAATAITLAGAGAGAANATTGPNLVTNGGFDDPSGQLTSGTTTDYTYQVPVDHPGSWTDGMYNPGTYTIASDPHSVHRLWVSVPGDNPMMIVNGMDQQSGANSTVWAQDVKLPAASVQSFPLLAGQTLQVGTIQVHPDPSENGKLCVNYALDPQAIANGWSITQTHLAIGNSPTDIPQSNGNPIPGQFKAASDTFTPGVTSHEYCGLTPGTVIAAHAVVTQSNPTTHLVTQTQTAWAGSSKFSGKNWALYASGAFANLPVYDFSMTGMNLYDGADSSGGADLTVTINGQQIDEAQLTGTAGQQIWFHGVVSPTDTAHIVIQNKTAVYSGNDFAIDNISLTQH